MNGLNFDMALSFASLISLLLDKTQSAASANVHEESRIDPLGNFTLQKTSLGQMLTGDISLWKNPSEQEGAAVCWGTGTSFTLIHFCLWKNFLQLVFPSHVKENILINFHSGAKNSIFLFLNKNMDEVPSL